MIGWLTHGPSATRHGVVLADKRSLEIYVFQRVVVTEFWRKLLFVGNRAVRCLEAMYFIRDNISPSKLS